MLEQLFQNQMFLQKQDWGEGRQNEENKIHCKMQLKISIDRI